MHLIFISIIILILTHWYILPYFLGQFLKQSLNIVQNRVLLSAYHNIFHPASANVLQMCASENHSALLSTLSASFFSVSMKIWNVTSYLWLENNIMHTHIHVLSLSCMSTEYVFVWSILGFSRKHKKRRPLKWVCGVDSWSVSSHCHFTNVCIYVVHFYLLRKAKVNYKFYKCNVAVKC